MEVEAGGKEREENLQNSGPRCRICSGRGGKQGPIAGERAVRVDKVSATGAGTGIEQETQEIEVQGEPVPAVRVGVGVRAEREEQTRNVGRRRGGRYQKGRQSRCSLCGRYWRRHRGSFSRADVISPAHVVRPRGLVELAGIRVDSKDWSASSGLRGHTPLEGIASWACFSELLV